VLEGWWARDDVRVPGEAMQGALISLALVFDIPVLHARDTDESARLIVYSARQLAGAGSRSSVWRNRIPKKPLSRRLHILQGLPGIGKERAQRLLERFGTLERCMSATEMELSAVEGIGPKTAASIREIVAGK
jgi:ERCC4-type nuclease